MAKCAKKGCPSQPLFGSRCTKHWLRRQEAYRLLPTHTHWWRMFEPGLIAGIEVREVTVDTFPPVIRLPATRSKWVPLIVRLVEAADAVRRKQHAGSVRSEAQEG